MSLPPEPNNWLAAMLSIVRHYGGHASEENVRVTLAWEQGTPHDTLLEIMARQLGLSIRLVPFTPLQLDPFRFPLVIEFIDGQIGVLTSTDGQEHYSFEFSGDHGLTTQLSLTEIQAKAKRIALLRPQTSLPDARVDHYIKPYRPNWFWQAVLQDWPRYGDVMLASLFANILALAALLFSMQVYDRVIPAQSEPTLWVLFTGVVIAMSFEFCLRMARAHLSDLLGKRADLKISDLVFGRALRLRTDARPKSTGSFIAQVREIEQIRELLTSTTMGIIADLPFFLLFLVVFWIIGGPLVWVIVAIIPLLVIPGLLIQYPLARLSNEGMREAALRNATLVEAIQGMEDIKLLRAEPGFQSQWNLFNDTASSISIRQRFFTNMLMTWTQTLQSGSYVIVLLAGSYLVMKGDMTTGALVGTSILASRMIAPLAQLSGVFARWQQVKISRQGLNDLLQRPVDQTEDIRQVRRTAVHGNYQLENIQFQYSEEDLSPVLTLPNLSIRAGEKIAILGHSGAGKSTLLQLLAGLHLPQQGSIRLDDIELSHLDPADLRRDMSLLTQNARLFHGTLRSNLTLGMPEATNEQLLQALSLSGALDFIRSCPNGLDELIQEGGLRLSGGQRQSLLLARTLLRNPSILLLDEPTTHLDDVTERRVITAMHTWLAPRTLIVATHKSSVLTWVDRIIILDRGRIIMDGDKEHVLRELTTERAK